MEQSTKDPTLDIASTDYTETKWDIASRANRKVIDYINKKIKDELHSR